MLTVRVEFWTIAGPWILDGGGGVRTDGVPESSRRRRHRACQHLPSEAYLIIKSLQQVPPSQPQTVKRSPRSLPRGIRTPSDPPLRAPLTLVSGEVDDGQCTIACIEERLVSPVTLSFFFVVFHVYIACFGNIFETHEFVGIRWLCRRLVLDHEHRLMVPSELQRTHINTTPN